MVDYLTDTFSNDADLTFISLDYACCVLGMNISNKNIA